MAINWIDTEITEHVRWTDSLASLKFKGNVLPYSAGQFTKIGLKVNGELVSRPYSYVSSPEEDYLEIVYVNVPGGVLTPELHKLEVGDKLFAMDKASGFFIMDEVPDGKNLWMLATGTGIGVFISLLKTDAPWKRFENIVLVHGVSTKNELTYQDQITKYEKLYPEKFSYIKTVTREKIDGCLNMRIPAAIENNEFEKISGISIAKDSQFMVCGNPDMINDTVELLGKSGLERNRRSKPGNITLEKYW
jgi:ferredoxin--NADP+ reductase